MANATAAIGDYERELRDVTGVKPKAKEDRQSFLRRLAAAINDLSDSQWEDLQKPTQEWANDAQKAIDAHEEIPDFPEDEEAEEAAPVKRGVKAKANGKAPNAEKRARGVLDPSGIKFRIKRMIIAKPDISAADIVAKMSKEGGDKPSEATVASIRAEFRHSLKVLKAEGVLDIDI